MIQVTFNKVHSFRMGFENSWNNLIVAETPVISDMKVGLNPYNSKALDITLSVQCNLSVKYPQLGKSHKNSPGSEAFIRATFSLMPIQDIAPNDFYVVVQNTIGILQSTLKTVFRYDVRVPKIPTVDEDNFADEAYRAYSYYFRPTIDKK